MTLAFITFFVSLFAMFYAGGMIPRAIGGLALILRLSQFVTAFFLVSFATSIPELFVGISSVIQNVSALSLGNILGSNLLNITLKVGLIVLIAGAVSSEGKVSSQNFWLVAVLSILPIFLGLDGMLSRIDGLILLTAFGLYIGKVFKDGEYFHKHKEVLAPEPRGLRSSAHIAKHIYLFLAGSSLLLASSFLLIWSSKEIVGAYFDSNFFLFGILFLAVGTQLPDFIFGVRASQNGQGSAMLGNTFGAMAYNAAGIVGLVALLRPISVGSPQNLLEIAALLLVSFALVHFFIYTKRKITRPRALMLVLVYLIFLALTVPECIRCIIGL
ncbi:MAG: sodium:calcium antiporter [Parcubacteria group bacterium]|nr:sodium:calcium antiporter [Parcubacteria group bacterium]